MDNSLTIEQRQQLRQRFKSSRTAIKSMLKQYKYQQEINHAQNMKKLSACLASVLDSDCMGDFYKYISDIDHMPIEINFNALRVQKLEQLFQDWLQSKEDGSASQLDHVLTVRFRNFLFRQVFIDEKETITDYFQTLSENNRLKGFDLYQLLINILSPYALYQFQSDSNTFFEKVNSFQNFIQVVDAFIKNERRIIVKDKTVQNDHLYIRKYEFESLIEFWENLNPELTLMQEPRKNLLDLGIQTIRVDSVNAETQADRLHLSTNYLGLINNTIHEINKLIEVQNRPYVLKSLNKVFDVLRKEKIVALAAETSEDLHKYENDELEIISRPPTFEGTPRSKSPFRSNMSRVAPIQKNKGQAQIKKIYHFLLKESQGQCLGVSELQIFFYHIGLVKAHENHIVKNLIDNSFISDPEDISWEEFKKFMKQLMKESEKLSVANLKKYIENNIDDEEREALIVNKRHRNGGSDSHRHEKVPHLNLLEKRNPKILSRSTFQLDSEDS